MTETKTERKLKKLCILKIQLDAKTHTNNILKQELKKLQEKVRSDAQKIHEMREKLIKQIEMP